MKKLHFNANGQKVGHMLLDKEDHANLKRQGKKIEFIHTYACSGDMIELRSGALALGCANIKGAGRGYVFKDEFEMARYLENVKQDYPWIKKWGKFMGSFKYYVDEQLSIAQKDNAPTDAIYKDIRGTWQRTSDICSIVTRQSLGL